jgi:hypothetical protein
VPAIITASEDRWTSNVLLVWEDRKKSVFLPGIEAHILGYPTPIPVTVQVDGFTFAIKIQL